MLSLKTNNVIIRIENRKSKIESNSKKIIDTDRRDETCIPFMWMANVSVREVVSYDKNFAVVLDKRKCLN